MKTRISFLLLILGIAPTLSATMTFEDFNNMSEVAKAQRAVNQLLASNQEYQRILVEIRFVQATLRSYRFGEMEVDEVHRQKCERKLNQLRMQTEDIRKQAMVRQVKTDGMTEAQLEEWEKWMDQAEAELTERQKRIKKVEDLRQEIKKIKEETEAMREEIRLIDEEERKMLEDKPKTIVGSCLAAFGMGAGLTGGMTLLGSSVLAIGALAIGKGIYAMTQDESAYLSEDSSSHQENTGNPNKPREEVESPH